MRYLIYFIIFLLVSAIILMGPWQKPLTDTADRPSDPETQMQ